MRTTGVILMLATLALSIAYLVAANFVLKREMPHRIERTYIVTGITGVIVSFFLYFA